MLVSPRSVNSFAFLSPCTTMCITRRIPARRPSKKRYFPGEPRREPPGTKTTSSQVPPLSLIIFSSTSSKLPTSILASGFFLVSFDTLFNLFSYPASLFDSSPLPGFSSISFFTRSIFSCSSATAALDAFACVSFSACNTSSLEKNSGVNLLFSPRTVSPSAWNSGTPTNPSFAIPALLYSSNAFMTCLLSGMNRKLTSTCSSPFFTSPPLPSTSSYTASNDVGSTCALFPSLGFSCFNVFSNPAASVGEKNSRAICLPVSSSPLTRMNSFFALTTA
mmetsp:Transcript_11927/g.33619  ORF Transcript_11927/g.33619 Transcript_11927/m.33619 type:complete len:277 (+) Transcript_11927:908-1738(+)